MSNESIKPLSELETATLKRVLNVLSSYSPDKMQSVAEDPNIVLRSLDFDSIDIIEITYAIEDNFGLEMINDEVLGKIETLGDVVSAILITKPKQPK